MSVPRRPVPYFSQWESRDLTTAVLSDADGPTAALRRDPHWARSGAESVEEYAAWAWNVCGMACLKMILAARTGRVLPMMDLTRACTRYGGYTVDATTSFIKGLIYAPFVRFVQEEFGLKAEVITSIAAAELPALFERVDFFIASVHSSIRWPAYNPPKKGGHLVLVLQADADAIVFHNPSGHDLRSQEYAVLSPRQFDDFFAGRGIAILP